MFSAKDISTDRDVRDGFDDNSDAVDVLYLTMGKSVARPSPRWPQAWRPDHRKGEPAFKSMGDGISQTITDLGPLIDGLGKVAEGLGQDQGAAGKTGRSTILARHAHARGDRRPSTRPQKAVDIYHATSTGQFGASAWVWGQVADGFGKVADSTGEVADAGTSAADARISTWYNRQQKAANDVADAFGHVMDSYVKSVEAGTKALTDQADALSKQAGAATSAADDQISFNGTRWTSSRRRTRTARRRPTTCATRRSTAKAQVCAGLRVDDRGGRGDGDGDGQARRPERRRCCRRPEHRQGVRQDGDPRLPSSR